MYFLKQGHETEVKEAKKGILLFPIPFLLMDQKILFTEST